jgi:hypothetical protein
MDNEVINRLRASKERFEAEELEAGKQVGSKWAKTEAEYRPLARVAAFAADASDSDMEPETLQLLIDPDREIDPREWVEFWEEQYGDGIPSKPFIRGFIEGATELYDEIAEQL